MKSQLKNKQPKTARAVHANRGIQAAYRKSLEAMIEKMAASAIYWMKAAYRKNPPRVAALVAQDEAPSISIGDDLSDLGKRWLEFFSEAAPRIGETYISRQFKASDSAFRKALADSGLAVKFTLTPTVRDALEASISENITLINSIPAQYFKDLQGIVMRSYSAGRDLETMTKEIKALYPKASHRATLIARDQSNKANATVTRIRQLEVGITESVWLHSHAGKNPRQDHVAANGKTYKIAKGCLISGEYIQPGEKINCRCVSRPILPT